MGGCYNSSTDAGAAGHRHIEHAQNRTPGVRERKAGDLCKIAILISVGRGAHHHWVPIGFDTWEIIVLYSTERPRATRQTECDGQEKFNIILDPSQYPSRPISDNAG